MRAVADERLNVLVDDRLIAALVEGHAAPEAVAEELDYAVEALGSLTPYLRQEWRIDQLERLEAAAKLILHHNFMHGVDGAAALQIAQFQKSISFLLKYKPYAVKCASPLGYSVFLQNPREGFSFQRHLVHKTEVFHIVRVMAGGFVFLCDFDSWREIYDPVGFEQWLGGRPDDRYERFRYRPAPGDVFVIDELNVVHTIVGCVVEEFATVSTDMVDRLHDQNAGRDIPPYFNRDRTMSQLRELAYPESSRLVQAGVGEEHEPARIAPLRLDGGSARVLVDAFVRGCHYRIDEARRGPVLHDPVRATSVYVTSGSGRVRIGDGAAPGRDHADSIAVAAGDLLLIAPDVPYAPSSDGTMPLAFTEHRIRPEVAFSPRAEHAT